MGEQGTVPLSVLHSQEKHKWPEQQGGLEGWTELGCLPAAYLVCPVAAVGLIASHTYSDNSLYPFPPYTVEKKADLGLE